jgi:hypothetical protein
MAHDAEWEFCEIECQNQEGIWIQCFPVMFTLQGKVVPHDGSGPIYGKIQYGIFERDSKRRQKHQRMIDEIVGRLISSGWHPITSHPRTSLPRFRRRAG